jgi:hypothetical protein
MTIEEIGKQIALWAKEVVIDLLRAWAYMYAIVTIIAYHLGV